MRKVWIGIMAIVIIALPLEVYSASKVFDYGFEDWTGDCATTANYPFYVCSSNDSAHLNGTEVIGSCNSNDASNWTPHSGSYFFYEQAYSGLSSDACLHAGDDPESVNTHNRIDIPDVTNEIFVHFYFRFAGQANTLADGYRMKFLDLETNGRYEGTKDMEVWSHFSSGGKMYFYDERNYDWGSGVSWPGSVNPLSDGEWHSYAIHANLQTGVLKVWMDTTDWQHPTVTRSGYSWYNAGDDTPATTFQYIYIHENYSSDNPTGSLQFGLDDIEIWDGIPSGGDPPPENPPGTPQGAHIEP